MSIKQIAAIFPIPRAHWVGDGFHVRPVFGDAAFTNTLSPFLMFDYGAPKYFPPTSRKLGVGQHPHRGFETVTIAFQGEIEHGDSVGNRGVIGPGDVQWMTAASGIVHEEFHSRNFATTGGTLEMCQLWVNLPKKHKMDSPRYQAISSGDIPVANLADDAGSVRVIAGKYDGLEGSATTFSSINIWDIQLKAAKCLRFQVENGHNTMLFVRSGAIKHNNGESKSTDIPPMQIVLLDKIGSTVDVEATEDTELLILSGEPLDEPIAARGPFVMTTQEELQQAMLDFQSGRMGRV